MSNLFVIVGLRIRDRRQFLAMSQKTLAEKIEVQRTTITNAELGRQKLPLDKISQIAEVLGVTLHDLIPNSIVNVKISIDGSEIDVPLEIADKIRGLISRCIVADIADE